MKTINKIVKNPNISFQYVIQRHNESDIFTIERNDYKLWEISVQDKEGYGNLLSVKKSKKEAIQFIEQF